MLSGTEQVNWFLEVAQSRISKGYVVKSPKPPKRRNYHEGLEVSPWCSLIGGTIEGDSIDSIGTTPNPKPQTLLLEGFFSSFPAIGTRIC